MHDAYKGRKTQFASIDSRVLKISRSVCIIDAKAFLLMISLIICNCMHLFQSLLCMFSPNRGAAKARRAPCRWQPQWWRTRLPRIGARAARGTGVSTPGLRGGRRGSRKRRALRRGTISRASEASLRRRCLV